MDFLKLVIGLCGLGYWAMDFFNLTGLSNILLVYNGAISILHPPHLKSTNYGVFFFFFAGFYGQRFWKREMNAKEFEFHVAGRQPGSDEGDNKTFKNVEDTIYLSYLQ